MTLEPPVLADTTMVRAGNVTFAVEQRAINDAAFNPEEQQRLGVADLRVSVADTGWSIRVLGTDDQVEYLRFDGFTLAPHYHYLVTSEARNRFDFDPIANGDFRQWALDRLDKHLAAMLRHADAGALAEHVEAEAISAALDRVRTLLDEG